MKRRDQRGRLKKAGFIIFVIVSLMIPGIASAGEFMLVNGMRCTYAISGDGLTIAGENYSNDGYTWTQADGLTHIPGVYGSYEAVPLGVSNDGIVVGYGLNGDAHQEAFIYNPATGSMTGLGSLPGASQVHSMASAISNDGTVVVGNSDSGNGSEAFLWTAGGGMVGLGDLDGGTFSSVARAVSGDGTVVVGSSDSASGSEAFLWTEEGGMEGLGYIGDYNGTFFSSAEGVSADGSTVVGVSSVDGGFEAFLWTEEDGMIGLGDLEGGDLDSHSLANDVSGDGSIVVGFSETDVGQEAFIWTEALGMVSLKDYLESLGMDLGDLILEAASSISDDGLTISGWCDGGDAFIVTLDSLPCTPAPIPGAVWLLGSGLVGLVGMRKRSRRHYKHIKIRV